MSVESLCKEAGWFNDNILRPIGKFSPGDFMHKLHRYTGNSPAATAALMGLAAGIPTYYATPYISEYIVRKMGAMQGKSPQQIEQDVIASRQNSPRMRTVLGIGAGLTAASVPLLYNYMGKKNDSKNGGWRSLFTYNHDTATPDKAAEHTRKKLGQPIRRKTPGFTQPGTQQQPFTKTHSLKKKAAWNAGDMNALNDTNANIPVHSSLNLLYSDQHLTGPEKIKAAAPFIAAEPDKSGLVSTSDLVMGAVRAGFGYFGGKALGSTLGAIMGAPTQVKDALSYSGGLAMALKNTGVI